MTRDRITAPMLASKVEDPTKIKFPVLATPKLDGYRCVKEKGLALTRNFLPIPNNYIRTWIEKELPDGLDGELMLPGGTFNETSHFVRNVEEKSTNIVYYLFDYVKDSLTKPYDERMEDLDTLCIKLLAKGIKIKPILPILIHTMEELNEFEADCLEDGFEGAMIRTVTSPYKLGRSSEKEGFLLKIKRFEDAEATILGCEERTTNTNEKQKNAFGRSKRSSAKEGLVPNGALGKLMVRDIKTGIQFGVGSGFNEAQRVEYWKKREELIGQIITYKYQPYGMDEAPRFPVFKSFRDTWDM